MAKVTITSNHFYECNVICMVVAEKEATACRAVNEPTVVKFSVETFVYRYTTKTDTGILAAFRGSATRMWPLLKTRSLE